MINWIIFDWGGVLFTINYLELAETIHHSFKQLSRKEIETILYGKELGYDYRNGKYNKKEFWQKTKQVIGKKFNTELLAQKWHESYKLNEQVLKIIKQLKQNYKIGVISGNIKERVQYLDKKYDVLKYFDSQVFSYEVGTNKPNPEIYEQFLKKTNEKGENCVFIDDEIKFIQSAQKYGIKTIHFKNAENLKKELKKNGIKIK
ncbi:MAG: HAD family phosphatase [Nanoarchaeota archaeon]|nr:HAD family phosphatase [Nanoarchaeota archaeon]